MRRVFFLGHRRDPTLPFNLQFCQAEWPSLVGMPRCSNWDVEEMPAFRPLIRAPFGPLSEQAALPSEFLSGNYMWISSTFWIGAPERVDLFFVSLMILCSFPRRTRTRAGRGIPFLFPRRRISSFPRSAFEFLSLMFLSPFLPFFPLSSPSYESARPFDTP